MIKDVNLRITLNGNPPTGSVQNYNGADYIPVGQIEEMLDEDFINWETTDFKFQIMRTDKYWFADASVKLVVQFSNTEIKRLMGAITFQISSQDVNMDYSATALSYATSNAAKKLGRRYGRALNNRLTKGDVLPVIQLQEQQQQYKEGEITKEYEALKDRIGAAKNYDEAKTLLETSMGFRFNPTLKKIVEDKKINI